MKGDSQSTNDAAAGKISTTIVLIALFFACVLSFLAISFKQYGGLHYLNHDALVGNAIAQSVGAVFIFPLLHIAIASLWKSKRNKKTLRNIFFGWAIVACVLLVVGLLQSGIV